MPRKKDKDKDNPKKVLLPQVVNKDEDGIKFVEYQPKVKSGIRKWLANYSIEHTISSDTRVIEAQTQQYKKIADYYSALHDANLSKDRAENFIIQRDTTKRLEDMELQEKELDLEMKKLAYEKAKLSIDRDRARLEREKGPVEEDDDPIDVLVRKIKAHAISIVKAREEIRKTFADNPELIDEMLERFEQELVERGISGGD